MKQTLTALVVLALLATACASGTADNGMTDNGAPDDPAPGAAGACLAGDPDCQDTLVPLPDEEPIEFDPDTGDPIVRGLAVSQVLETQIDGGFAIRGYFYDDGTGPRLCESLAESFPPQCAGPAIQLDLNGNQPPEGVSSEQGISWTDTEVEIIGQVVDGAFVADPADG